MGVKMGSILTYSFSFGGIFMLGHEKYFPASRMSDQALCYLTLFSVLLVLSFGGGCSNGDLSSGSGPQAPVILDFSANPATITTNSTTLTWSVEGATKIDIDHGVGEVTGTTSTHVNPTATTIYTLTASNAVGSNTAQTTVTVALTGTIRIAYLHHSTGGNVWSGGVPEFFDTYNTDHGTDYQIGEHNYPDTGGGYPWANYPHDYWNLWVNHTGTSQDRGELNLDQLAAQYDVIMFKHCFPVSNIQSDSDCGTASVSSECKSVANYQAQYEALKVRMHGFPNKKFVVWTGAALIQGATTQEEAGRARDFFNWVKTTWDVPGDNIFVWDFWSLETTGSGAGLYLNPDFSAGDSHPNASFCETVAPYIAQRIIDVIEGRGDSGSITGEE
jgi:hypothetical protein